MTFDPFLNAPVYIQIHAPAALIALMLGLIALYRRKRDRAHKVVGYVWMVAMLTTAITSFWIREIMADGSMSPVHLLSIFSICTIVYAIWMARRGNILGHKRALQNLYFMGSWGAFAINFLPNRTIPNMFFDGGTVGTFATAAFIIGTIVISPNLAARAQRRRNLILPLHRARGLL